MDEGDATDMDRGAAQTVVALIDIMLKGVYYEAERMGDCQSDCNPILRNIAVGGCDFAAILCNNLVGGGDGGAILRNILVGGGDGFAILRIIAVGGGDGVAFSGKIKVGGGNGDDGGCDQLGW